MEVAMNTSNSTVVWSDLAQLADDAIPLLDTALLIARDEYPDLDADACREQMAGHVRAINAKLPTDRTLAQSLQAINRHLFEDSGYAGNHDDYFDPRNSYLNEVLNRRLGIPITLAVIQMEVTRRLGLDMDGISFPGHFLVRVAAPDGLIVLDPFNRGRPLAAEELRQRASEHLDGLMPDDSQLLSILEPASHRDILTRMLQNLKAVYSERGEWDRVARTCDRALQLCPDRSSELRDRGMAYRALGYHAGARADLTRYLAMNPDGDDESEVRDALIEAGAGRTRLN